MILSKEEAVCLVLGFSRQHEVSSPTKLNKLLSRLNLFYIPIDIVFSLNKFGAFNADLSGIETNDYYEISPYQYMGRSVNKFKLKENGKKVLEKVIYSKLSKILTEEELNSLRDLIRKLSEMSASEISNNEHKVLLLDVEDRHKLIDKVNTVLVDMNDLYSKLNDIPENKIAEIRLRALIEFCYYLSRYLKKKFDRLNEEYDFDAYMFDYYFLYHIHLITSFLDEQIKKEDKDGKTINKYYQYIINSVRGNYPFSIDNKNLKEILV